MKDKRNFFYNVTVPKLVVKTGGINTSGNLTVSRSEPTGENVVTSIINSGQNCFSSLYLQTTNQTINETGQLFVGHPHLIHSGASADEHNIRLHFYMELNNKKEQLFTDIPESIAVPVPDVDAKMTTMREKRQADRDELEDKKRIRVETMRANR